MTARWGTGVWLGKAGRTDESIVWSEGAVQKCRSIKARTPSESWDVKALEGVTLPVWCAPERAQDVHPEPPPPFFPADAPGEPAAAQPEAPKVPRSFAIQRAHLEKVWVHTQLQEVQGPAAKWQVPIEFGT